MKKIIRYRLSVSVKFPATHPRKGDNTFFREKILNAIIPAGLLSISERERLNPFSMFTFYTCEPKIHTIRANYQLWQKRFEKINKGEAVLELYYWSGKPYNSKCITICQLGKDDGIGVQSIDINPFGIDYNIDFKGWVYGEGHILSKNDGLSEQDMKSWFKNYDLSEPMAIIHFTKFRY